jgi:hypothetical protein
MPHTQYRAARQQKQTKKRSPEWREQVHCEALAALARCKARDAAWRKRRAEAKACIEVKS